MNNKLLCRIILFILVAISTITIHQVKSFENSEQESSNPKPASASVYNLGLKSYENGDLQSAITYFKKAVDLDPSFVDAYYNLGAIYKAQKNYYDAIQIFQKAITINPKDYEVIFELASCYFEEKNYPKARQYFSFIPLDFYKSNEAKQKLDLINTYVTIENTPENEKQAQIKSPNVQAQLLVDKLTKIQETSKEEKKEPLQIQDVPPQVQSQILINTLKKPSQKASNEDYRITLSNFKGPTGITKDSKNNIYVANFAKDSIERINQSGTREIFVERNGIKGPIGLTIDENDNLYIANYSDGSILKITPEREISYLIRDIQKPYYLFYDNQTKKLFVTVQGINSLIEINTAGIITQPITSR